jgi:hypothetical protein
VRSKYRGGNYRRLKYWLDRDVKITMIMVPPDGNESTMGTTDPTKDRPLIRHRFAGQPVQVIYKPEGEAL